MTSDFFECLWAIADQAMVGVCPILQLCLSSLSATNTQWPFLTICRCKMTNMTICVYFLIHGTYHLMGVDLIPWPEWLCKPVYLSTCLTHWAKHTVQSKQPWMVASTGRRPGLQRQFQKAIGFGKLISWRVLQGDISWWKWKGRVGVGGDIRKLITSAK